MTNQQTNSDTAVSARAKAQPQNFDMVIQGGMLDALGINMYSTLAKSMVEFVANAYDGEATFVDVTIPFDRIAAARNAVRAQAKDAVANGTMDPFTVLLLPLPDDIQIVITDDGHGMDPEDVRGKFLPVNRKRRLDGDGKEKNLHSENRRRKVMGRKGLGKLAGFGVAEKVTVKTKRAEDEFWTVFEMDYAELSSAPNLGSVKIPATYPHGVIGEKGTIITLSRLRCDALKRGSDDLQHTLHQNFFGVRVEDFSIKVNGKPLDTPSIEYDFIYPPEENRTHDGFARDEVKVDDVGSLQFDYVVKFRKAGDSLRSDQRGARIYCHNRLAAGPSLFRLPSGVHNYHGQDYMECIVQADILDELGIDLVSTDRTQLKGESELVIAFIDRITDILRLALNAHYKHKDQAVEQQIKTQKSNWLRIIERMDKKTREPARKLLKTLGTQFGVGSKEFEEIAPLVMDTMNAGEVLVRLIEIGTNPADLPAIADALRDLAEVEKSQALTIFRGRREAINALRQLADRGEEEWRKKQFEAELHSLLKKYPWLIRQEFSRHVTSDETLEKTCSELAKELEVDHFSVDNPKKPDLRPDLVFLMNDPQVHEVCVVELKSPSIPLEIGHLTQLQGYISDVEAWLNRKFNHPIAVTGYLIGTREKPEKRTRDAQTLENQISKAGPNTEWKVYDLRELIRNTEMAHAEIIGALEKDLGEDHILLAQRTPPGQPSPVAANDGSAAGAAPDSTAPLTTAPETEIKTASK
ncbi:MULTISPECIES: ATP-binding protein [Burkholderia]|jgi:hypothetical protein|uniref:ATP-binding protein n=1 Tax=Burkholderia TaxID=32008 RepID=UPI001B987873|nr:ATP-binding protein [Burkholderia multivorans]MBR8048668.1 ATP-binding protein [Burkholderia multivorans]MCA8225482.1 ATP-binding protein [Burkholderia multivorans]